jgi:hypothetical protein
MTARKRIRGMCPAKEMESSPTRGNSGMKNVGVLILCVATCMPLPLLAQEKSQTSSGNAA